MDCGEASRVFVPRSSFYFITSSILLSSRVDALGVNPLHCWPHTTYSFGQLESHIPVCWLTLCLLALLSPCNVLKGSPSSLYPSPVELYRILEDRPPTQKVELCPISAWLSPWTDAHTFTLIRHGLSRLPRPTTFIPSCREFPKSPLRLLLSTDPASCPATRLTHHLNHPHLGTVALRKR